MGIINYSKQWAILAVLLLTFSLFADDDSDKEGLSKLLDRHGDSLKKVEPGSKQTNATKDFIVETFPGQFPKHVKDGSGIGLMYDRKTGSAWHSADPGTLDGQSFFLVTAPGKDAKEGKIGNGTVSAFFPYGRDRKIITVDCGANDAAFCGKVADTGEFFMVYRGRKRGDDWKAFVGKQAYDRDDKLGSGQEGYMTFRPVGAKGDEGRLYFYDGKRPAIDRSPGDQEKKEALKPILDPLMFTR